MPEQAKAKYSNGVKKETKKPAKKKQEIAKECMDVVSAIVKLFWRF